MANINFMYRSIKEKSNLNLRLLFRHNGIDKVIGAKTKISVTKEYWNKYHFKTRLKDIDLINTQNNVNNSINRIRNHLLTAFENSDKTYVDKKWLNEQLKLYYNPDIEEKNKKKPKKLIDYANFYVEYRKNELKLTSIKKYRVIINKLKRFQDFRKKVIMVDEVGEDFKNEFVKYQKDESYGQNNIQRELVMVKTFCKHARYMGLPIHPQLDSLKVPKKKCKIIYLNFKEIEKIEKLKDLDGYLDDCRDWLIISCYLGQRISDFMKIDKSSIRLERGREIIEFTQQKTDRIMAIPVHPKIKEILKKREGDFPRKLSHQRYNYNIKLICEKAGINQIIEGYKLGETEQGNKKYRKIKGFYKKSDLISSHVGRRSFASNFYGKIPTHLLMNVTGHSSEATFLTYIGKSNTDMSMEIGNYF